ncbi:MAG: sigma-54-dependent Fis family transcriptional regulator [Phycisphaerales bacterium]|nr:sigma-54-dependent Fis family transcriptional regulator [Phycisphaerales bacterium]
MPHADDLRAQVLLIDDEPDHADVMADALRKPGHVCTIVNSAPAAFEELRGGSFDIIITDLRMPNSAGFAPPGDGRGVPPEAARVAPDGGNAGLVVLHGAKTLQPSAETIMVTAHGDVPTARAAFKLGVFDFIEKPLDLELFRSLVNRAAETVLLRHSAAQIDGGGELVQHDGFEGIIAGSEAMRRILQTVRSVAASNLPVLITGESGTGKELIASAIHRNSPRRANRFVPFNCAGQSETLLEDQLFGHVRGAFTGADKDREGLFEYASQGPDKAAGGGTLFLDELGDMPLTMQAKLLRVLETGEVVRLGSNDPRKTNVRLVSATNRDLKKAIADKQFREDLYFRIKGAEIALPPLRERRDDIPRIVRHAIARFAQQNRLPAVPDITDAAMMRLTAFNWPGNVRQLLNVVQNMTVIAGGAGETLDVRHIPDDIRSVDDDAPGSGDSAAAGAGGGSLAGTSLEALEKRAIRETLRLTAGNREQAAKLLGIGERTLYRKLKEYGLR